MGGHGAGVDRGNDAQVHCGMTSFREMARENPNFTASTVALYLALYLAVGLLRPRWLTYASRRTPRRWLCVITMRLVVIAALEAWIRPRMLRAVPSATA